VVVVNAGNTAAAAVPVSTMAMMKSGQATNPALLPNPPSIPSHDNVFGYEIN